MLFLGPLCLPLLYLHDSSGIICIFVAITKAHAFNNNAFFCTIKLFLVKALSSIAETSCSAYYTHTEMYVPMYTYT